MSDKLTLSVCLTPEKLRSTASLLTQLAVIVEGNGSADVNLPPAAPAKPSAPPAPSNLSAGEQLQAELDGGSEPDPTQVFGSQGDTPSLPAATTAPPVTVELDADGIPWDGRIHAPSKAKLKKTDTWKLKRGVDKKLAEQIIEELKQTMQASGGVATPTAPPAPAVPAEPSTTTPPAPPQNSVVDFSSLIKKITGNLQNGKISNAQVTEMLQTFELASIPMLKNRPDLWGMVDQHLDSLLAEG